MVGTETHTYSSLIDKVKTSLRIDTLTSKLQLSTNKLIEMGVYLGIGFLSGFLLKKYSSYVFVFVLFLVGIVVLQHLGVLSVVINWTKVQELFGIQPAVLSDATVFALYWEWIKMNFALVLSFSIGFLIGLRIG